MFLQILALHSSFNFKFRQILYVIFAYARVKVYRKDRWAQGVFTLIEIVVPRK